MIHWKFRDRWRINMSHKGRHKRTQFIRVFWVIQYESSITKFSVNHKYDVLSSMRRKSGWIMHVSHKYDSFKDATKSEFTDSNFLFFAWAVTSNFKNFGLTYLQIKFLIEWYAYHAYFSSRICNIADVLKMEHTQ